MTPAERAARRYLRELQLEKAAALPAAQVADFATLDPTAAFVLSERELDALCWEHVQRLADEELDRELGGGS